MPQTLPLEDVVRWRKAERERLIALRLATPSEVRNRSSRLISAALESVLGEVSGRVVSLYAAFRGEPVLRDLMKRIVERGGRTALPVVIGRGQSLIFRVWTPGDPTRRGVWNIPEPSETAEVVAPDVVVAPVVGFDSACFRLGYGGGFYDRTLASLATRPRVFGVGYSQAAIPTIHPQAHDIPMDIVVTEQGVQQTRASGTASPMAS
jgi:5-formyltetrahydrofolate cyclo-ligase